MKWIEYTPVTHDDDYWTHDTPLFVGSFPYYRNDARMVQGRIHVSAEQYFGAASEIIPLKTRKGTCFYIMMHPCVLEPDIFMAVGLYPKPKLYANQDDAVGEVLSTQVKGMRQHQIGNSQAWYYPADKTIVLWECFKEQGNMSTIRCNTKLFKIGSWTLLRLPKSASAKLPSRGMTMVEGTINGFRFQAALEPDGKGSHWFRFNKTMLDAAGADAGDTVTLAIEPTKEWPEPEVPADLKNALAAAPQAHTLWMNITPMARWDWIRWIGSTKQPETRRRRIEVACSKLKAGERRPCCFNRTLCTEPYVSNNGVLLEPTQEIMK